MEDIDPQATRKRPRLDSGSHSHNLDLDLDHMPLPSASPDSPSSRVDPPQAVAGCSPPKTPDRHPPPSSCSPQHGTPSSSTLAVNMKPSASPNDKNNDDPDPDPDSELFATTATTQHDPSNDDAETSVTERGETPEPELLPKSADASPQGVVDVSAVSAAASSPAASSLQIEVAEVEDMDQDPGMSSWRPLEDALHPHANAEEPDGVQLQDKFSPAASFPSLRRSKGLREAVEDIRKVLEKGEL